MNGWGVVRIKKKMLMSMDQQVYTKIECDRLLFNDVVCRLIKCEDNPFQKKVQYRL